MSNFIDQAKVVVTSLALSSVLVVAGSVVTSEKQKVLLEQNMLTTQRLSDTIIDLRIEMASSKEKFVTRDELRTEIQRSVRNGS